MNPFLMYLMNLIQNSGFSDANNPFMQMQQQNPFGGSAFNPFDFTGQGLGGGQFNPFPPSLPPMAQPRQGLPSRPMDNRRRVEGGGGGLQPVPSQPVDIPAPFNPIPPRNPFGPQLSPVPSPLMDIPAPVGGPLGTMMANPYETPPYIPPPDGPIVFEPMPGLKIPINMQGIFGQSPMGSQLPLGGQMMQQGIGRAVNPNGMGQGRNPFLR